MNKISTWALIAALGLAAPAFAQEGAIRHDNRTIGNDNQDIHNDNQLYQSSNRSRRKRGDTPGFLAGDHRRSCRLSGLRALDTLLASNLSSSQQGRC